jgi:lipid-binding SYLF domain-containing protein
MRHILNRRGLLTGVPKLAAGAAFGTVAAGAFTSLGSRPAFAGTDQTELLANAKTTLSEAMHDPQFGDAKDLFGRSRAVMIVPTLTKGGFFIGAEGGNGVLMLSHTGDGLGSPLFYTIVSASFGLQIGLEVAQMVLFVMSEKALRAWTNNQVTLGADAGLTVLVVGSNASAASTTNLNADIIAWAKAKGAFAGISLAGSVIKPREEWNLAYYGHAVSPQAILHLGA